MRRVQDSATGIDRIKQFISDYHGLSREALEQSLYVYPDAQGVRHTFRVASSLDSMVLGEAQILGQLKDAFDIALKTKTTSTILNKLIKKAISVAKRVRTETRLAEGAVSISSAAVELAKKIFGDLDGQDRHAPGRRRDGGTCRPAPPGQRREEHHGRQPHLRTRRRACQGVQGRRHPVRAFSRCPGDGRHPDLRDRRAELCRQPRHGQPRRSRNGATNPSS